MQHLEMNEFLSCHVLFSGCFWFQSLCQALDVSESHTFRSLLSELCPDMQNGNFNHKARQEAGLQQDW